MGQLRGGLEAVCRSREGQRFGGIGTCHPSCLLENPALIKSFLWPEVCDRWSFLMIRASIEAFFPPAYWSNVQRTHGLDDIKVTPIRVGKNLKIVSLTSCHVLSRCLLTDFNWWNPSLCILQMRFRPNSCHGSLEDATQAMQMQILRKMSIFTERLSFWKPNSARLAFNNIWTSLLIAHTITFT